MSDEPKEWWRKVPLINSIGANPADELAKRQADDTQQRRKLDELESDPNFLSSDKDITSFLLQGLQGNNLDAAVGFIGANEEAQKSEAEKLREAAKIKASQVAIKYKLDTEDSIALEQLYLGFSQANLIDSNKGYRIKISRGEKTQYKDLPQEAKVSQGQSPDPNLELAIRAYPVRLRGKELPEQERMVASEALWNAILAEFSDLRYLSEGEQLRKSPHPTFARTAIYSLAIINILNESHTQNKPKVLEIAPVNEINTRVRNFRDFRAGVGNAISDTRPE